ncbi:MAG TPA: hypothetical protein VLT90_07000 [Terriglobales bacterium]|nr:hypothetical protein [Terriglobales bacterium]
MILLVTPNLRSDDCALAIRRAVNENVVVAESLHKAAALLRAESYAAVVLDQYLFETEPHQTETVMEHLGTAIPLQVNLAISGVERLGREVRAAVQRRKREEKAARKAAVSALQAELNSTVTALLLSCEIALGTPGLPVEAREKLQSAHELIKKLCSQLEASLVAV